MPNITELTALFANNALFLSVLLQLQKLSSEWGSEWFITWPVSSACFYFTVE